MIVSLKFEILFCRMDNVFERLTFDLDKNRKIYIMDVDFNTQTDNTQTHQNLTHLLPYHRHSNDSMVRTVWKNEKKKRAKTQKKMFLGFSGQKH